MTNIHCRPICLQENNSSRQVMRNTVFSWQGEKKHRGQQPLLRFRAECVHKKSRKLHLQVRNTLLVWSHKFPCFNQVGYKLQSKLLLRSKGFNTQNHQNIQIKTIIHSLITNSLWSWLRLVVDVLLFLLGGLLELMAFLYILSNLVLSLNVLTLQELSLARRTCE